MFPGPNQTTFNPDAVSLPPHSVDGPLTRQQRAHYHQGVKNVDTLLGELRSIASEHLGDNTLFLYTSDHGAQWAFGKWTLYDYGTRVPLVAAWPGKIQPGSTTTAMVSWIDLIPTLIDIGGGKVPTGIDGKSFLPILLDPSKAHRKRIFTTHSGDKGMNVYPIRAVRTADWKLIHNLRPDLAWTNHSDLLRKPLAGIHMTEWAKLAETDDQARAIMHRYYQRPAFEFYHVSVDPWEMNNLIDDPSYADQIEAHKMELAAWMHSQNDSGKVFGPPRPLDQPETWHPDYWESTLNP
jgi:N-sulfoglucosamine sulfohydrolase